MSGTMRAFSFQLGNLICNRWSTLLFAARQAGEMIVKAADNLDSVKVDEKGRHDFVTEVDRRSEELIIEQIKKAYPDHRFLGEEGDKAEMTIVTLSGL